MALVDENILDYSMQQHFAYRFGHGPAEAL
jgi:hypothetical protein